MKKNLIRLLSMLLCLVMVIAMFPAAVLPQVSAEDIEDPLAIPNADFSEGTISDWTFAEGTVADVTGKYKTDANLGVKMVGPGSATSKAAAIIGGNRYVGSIDYSGTAKATLTLQFLDGSSKVITGGTFTATAEPSTDWQTVFVDVVSPDTAVYARLVLATDASAGEEDYAIFDNGKIHLSLTPTGSQGPSSIENGDFEGSYDATAHLPEGWTSYVASTQSNASLVTEANGNQYMNFKGVTCGLQSSAIGVSSGKNYIAKVDAKAVAGKGQIVLRFYDENGNSISSSQKATLVASSSWTTYKLEGIAPSAAVTAKLLLITPSGASNDACFDNASLAMEPLATEIVNGDFQGAYDTATHLPEGYTPWVTGTMSKAAMVTEENGNKYMTFKGVTCGVQSSAIAVTPGETYIAQADGKANAGLGQIVLRFFDRNGANIVAGQKSVNVRSLEWATYKIEGIAPAGAATAKIILITPSGDTNDVCFDNADLYQKPLATDIDNGNFEGNYDATEHMPEGWTPYIFSQRIYGDLIAEDNGNHYMSITNVTCGVVSSALVAEPGATYTITVDGRAVENAGQVVLRFYDHAEQAILGAQKSVNVTSSDWQTYTVEGEAPLTAAYVRALLITPGAGGVVHYDNASLKKTKESTIEGPIIINLLPNPSFELGTIAHWTKLAADPATVDIIRNDFHSEEEGNYAANLFDATRSLNCAFRSEKVPVTPGTVYRLTADLFMESGTGAIYLYLEYWKQSKDADGNLLFEANGDPKLERMTDLDATPTITMHEWQQVVTTSMAPAEAMYASAMIASNTADFSNGFADNFKLAEFTPIAYPWVVEEDGHPHLYFTADEVDDIIARASNQNITAFGYSQADVAEAIIEEADGYLKDKSLTLIYYGGYNYTFPEIGKQPPLWIPAPPGYNNSLYPYWGNYCKNLQSRLQALTMAWLLTGESKYSNKAISLAMDISKWDCWAQPPKENWDPAVDTKNTGLDSSYLLQGVCMVYDVCYSLLSQKQRDTIVNAIVENALEPCYKLAWNHVDNNIPLVRAAGLGIGACAIADENDPELMAKVNKYLDVAMDYYNWYLDSRVGSGSQEGYSYSSFALNTLLVGVDCIARLTGEDDLMYHEYFTSGLLTDWICNFTAPSTYTSPAYSDSNEDTYYFTTLNLLNRLYGESDDPQLRQVAGEAGYYLKTARPSATNLEKFLYTSDNPVIAYPEDNVHVMEDLGWSAMRNDWYDNNSMLMTMVSNASSMNHNHYDQNSIQLAFNGAWMISDPGYADLSPGTNKNQFTVWDGHTVIYVDGKSQSVKGTGSTEEIISTQDYGHVIGSAAEAYGRGVLTQNDRNVIMINHAKNPYYVVIDELNSSSKHDYGWNMYVGNWQHMFQEDGTYVNVGDDFYTNSISLQKSSKNLFVNFVGENPLHFVTGEFRDTGYYTVIANATEKNKEYQFMSVINATNDQASIAAPNLLDTVVTNADQEVKLVDANGTSCVFFRGQDIGDYIEFTFTVDATNTYSMSVTLPDALGYAGYQFSIDGVNYGDIFLGAKDPLEMTTHPLSDVYLEEGEHVLRMTLAKLAGTGAAGYFISLGAINFANEVKAPIPTVTINEHFDNEDVLGAEVQAGETRDLILYNRSGSAIEVANAETDAEIISILDITDETINEGFAGQGISFLNYNGDVHFQSDEAVDLAVSYLRGDKTYDIVSEDHQSVTVFVTGPIKYVELDGELTTDYTLDGTALTIDIPMGRSTLVVSHREPVTGVEVTPETMLLKVGERGQLSYWIDPELATVQTVKWRSEDESLATVESKTGRVTGTGLGDVHVKAITDDGKFEDYCVVSVVRNDVMQVEYLIDLIGEVNVNDVTRVQLNTAANLFVDMSEAVLVDTARKAYNDLTMVQKDKIENYPVLLKAEDALMTQLYFLAGSFAQGTGYKFTDVPSDSWYYKSVKMAWEHDLIDGINETTFAPENNLTRAQAVKLAAALHEMYNRDMVTLANGTVNWYDTYVDYAVKEGIIEAKYDSYTPAQMNAAISRDEFVHIFFGAMPEETYGAWNSVADNAIPDVKLSAQFAEEIYAFYRAGILTGSDAQGTFNPNSNIKRSEVAAILIRMYNEGERMGFTLQ